MEGRWQKETRGWFLKGQDHKAGCGERSSCLVLWSDAGRLDRGPAAGKAPEKSVFVVSLGGESDVTQVESAKERNHIETKIT